MKQFYVNDIILIKQNMLNSVTRTMFIGVLHIDHKSQLGFTNTKIRPLHGLGLVAILTLACGLHRVPVSRSEAHCPVAEPHVVIR